MTSTSSDTVLPALVGALEDVLPGVLSERIAEVEISVPEIKEYILDITDERAIHLAPCVLVLPTPRLNELREWHTPQRDDGIACEVGVVHQGGTSPEATERGLVYQAALDIALKQIGRDHLISGVWRVRVEAPFDEPAGEDKYRRRAGHQVRLWARVKEISNA